MRVFFLIFFVIATATAENDESWTWNDKQKTSRDADARCAVSIHDLLHIIYYILSNNM